MSDKLTWTFRSVPFIVTGSDRVRPRFEHEPRGSVHNFIGNGVAEFLSFGFQEYRMEVPVLVFSDGYANTLDSYQLSSGSLITDEETLLNVVLMKATFRRRATNYLEGTLSFAKSGT